MTEFTVEQKLAEVRREIKYRRWVYPRKAYKSLAEQDLDARRLEIMLAIEADYDKLAEKERLL